MTDQDNPSPAEPTTRPAVDSGGGDGNQPQHVETFEDWGDYIIHKDGTPKDKGSRFLEGLLELKRTVRN